MKSSLRDEIKIRREVLFLKLMSSESIWVCHTIAMLSRHKKPNKSGILDFVWGGISVGQICPSTLLARSGLYLPESFLL